MKHHYWVLCNGTLMVEKYIGDIKLEEILQNDQMLIEDIIPEHAISHWLSDISEATFPDVAFEDIEKLFLSIDNHPELTQGMKIALYTGASHYKDFQKASEYARKGSTRPFSVVPFNFLTSALEWLELNDAEQFEVTVQDYSLMAEWLIPEINRNFINFR